MNKNCRSTVIRRCDQAMAFFFYALIYFLPIAPALIEWCFGLTLLSYLIKRGFIFYPRLREEASQGKAGGLGTGIRLFLQSYKPVDDSLNKPLGLFVLVAFVSVLFSIDVGLSLKGFVFKLLQSVFTYFFFVEAICTRKRLKIFLTIYLISFTLIATNGIFQYFSGWEFIHLQLMTDGRVTSSFKHANDLSAYLVIFLPCLLNLSVMRLLKKGKNLASSLEGGQGPYGFFASRGFCDLAGLVGGIGGICLGLTFSRAAWLGLGVSLLILSRQKRTLIFSLLLLALFSMIFIPKMMKERESNVIQAGLLTTSSRPQYWSEAFQLIKERPLTGVGLNAYTESSSRHGFSGYPHNSFLQLTAELGMIGGGVFLWVLYLFFHQAVRQTSLIQDGLAKDLLSGLTAGFAGFLVQSFFDTSFYSAKLSILMWVVMGFIAVLPKIESRT